MAEHVRDCPRCKGLLLILVDGKHGARRLICANLDGVAVFKDFDVAMHTGCTNHAPPKGFYCRRCSPLLMKQEALITQNKVLAVSTVGDQNAGAMEVRYTVECVMPDEQEVFEYDLPRSEVK